jgi:hypothetical protein
MTNMRSASPESGTSRPAIWACVLLPVLCSGIFAACPDGFSGTVLAPAWTFLDADGAPGGAHALAGGKLELAGRGRDAFKAVNEFVGIRRKDITGDFDVSVKIESQTDTHDWAQAGILAASDLTHLEKGGYVVLDVSPANGYNLFYDSAEPVGGLDKLVTASGVSTVYPVWLRLAKTGGRFSAWYRHKADAPWNIIAKDILPLGDVSPSEIALVSLSHNQALEGKTVFDDFECIHEAPSSLGPESHSGAAYFRNRSPTSAQAAPAWRNLAGRMIGTNSEGFGFAVDRALPVPSIR